MEEHRPKSHRKNAEWPPSRIVEWAGSVGPSTARAVEAILNGKRHPEQGYRSCLGLKSIESMLKNNLDRQDPPVPAIGGEEASPLLHDNIRGADYYLPGPAAGAGEMGSVSC